MMDIKIAYIVEKEERYEKGLHRSSNGWVAGWSSVSECIGIFVEKNDFFISLHDYEVISEICYKCWPKATHWSSSSDGDGSGSFHLWKECSQGIVNISQQLNDVLEKRYNLHFVPASNAEDLHYNFLDILRAPFESYYGIWNNKYDEITNEIKDIEKEISELTQKKIILQASREHECVYACSKELVELISNGLIDVNQRFRNGCLLSNAIGNPELLTTIYRCEKVPFRKNEIRRLQDELLKSKCWIGFFSELVYGKKELKIERWDFFALALPALPDEIICNLFSDEPTTLDYESIIIPKEIFSMISKRLFNLLQSKWDKYVIAFVDTIPIVIKELETSGRKGTAFSIVDDLQWYISSGLLLTGGDKGLVPVTH